jgi:hypothetical protein
LSEQGYGTSVITSYWRWSLSITNNWGLCGPIGGNMGLG